MTIEIQEGDYFKTEGLTQEQYEFLVGKFLEAGCEVNYNCFFKHSLYILETYPYVGWYDERLCFTCNPKPNAREIKLTDFKEYQMDKPVEFPDYDFKLDCGDDPKVRQWLKNNGCEWLSGHDIVEYLPNGKLLSIDKRGSVTQSLSNDDFNKYHSRIPKVTPVFKTIVSDLIIEKPVDNKLKDELKLLEEQQREIAEKMKELQDKIGK